ncbi:cell surface glycoprotein MUC18-like [Hypanus sabinus]|uniref:cell surface glycoprotein MUC18-like n=1 Tax=Hypanus sabinus TaxID=79690 RepID=UPI0028C42E0F|nr:cell surface glycoprotein MUC18-like [Hypanus sabinus]
MATSPAVICGFLLSICVHFVPAQDQSGSASVRLLAEVGKELQLSCGPPHEHKTLTVRWLQKASSMNKWEEITGLPGDEAPVDEERFMVLENGNLVITSVKVKDEGLFKCQMGENALEHHSIISVAVFKIPTEPVLDVGYLTFTAGEQSEIGTCISTNGYPLNNIIWYKNGRQVVATGKEVQIKVHNIRNQNTKLYTTKSTLYYVLSKRDINTEFFCGVSYPSEGSFKMLSSKPIQVDVYYAIENVMIEVEPSNNVSEGDSVRLKCMADANPLPEEYNWEKDGKSIINSKQFTIQSVSKSDEGFYQCTVFDFNFKMKSAVEMIQVTAKENNELWSGEPGFLKTEKRQNRVGMIIGIIMAFALVTFFLSVAYYFCYYGKKEEKKPLEDVEEIPVMDPEKDSATEEKVEEPVLAK